RSGTRVRARRKGTVTPRPPPEYPHGSRCGCESGLQGADRGRRAYDSRGDAVDCRSVWRAVPARRRIRRRAGQAGSLRRHDRRARSRREYCRRASRPRHMGREPGWRARAYGYRASASLMSAAGTSSDAGAAGAKAATPIWRRAIPYAGTLAIFALIFWRIPLGKVGDALRDVPVGEFIAIFLPYSLFFFVLDSYCLTWVVRR